MLTAISLPKYNTILPISKEKVEFRPFTVKESKVLMLAQEEETSEATNDAIAQIISNCTFQKHSIDTLNKIDAEYLFIQLRNKAMGEGVSVNGICKECGHKTPMMMNLENIVVTNTDEKLKPFKIMDNLWLELKYPTMKDAMSVQTSDGNTAIAMSLAAVITEDSVKVASEYTLQERIDFVESLTELQLSAIKPFFDTFPIIVLDFKFPCKCGFENTVHIEGIENFFL